MSKAKAGTDKNLQNVAADLDQIPVNSHHAQQIQQDSNDRRHQDSMNHDKNGRYGPIPFLIHEEEGTT